MEWHDELEKVRCSSYISIQFLFVQIDTTETVNSKIFRKNIKFLKAIRQIDHRHQ